MKLLLPFLLSLTAAYSNFTKDLIEHRGKLLRYQWDRPCELGQFCPKPLHDVLNDLDDIDSKLVLLRLFVATENNKLEKETDDVISTFRSVKTTYDKYFMPWVSAAKRLSTMKNFSHDDIENLRKIVRQEEVKMNENQKPRCGYFKILVELKLTTLKAKVLKTLLILGESKDSPYDSQLKAVEGIIEKTKKMLEDFRVWCIGDGFCASSFGGSIVEVEAPTDTKCDFLVKLDHFKELERKQGELQSEISQLRTESFKTLAGNGMNYKYKPKDYAFHQVQLLEKLFSKLQAEKPDCWLKINKDLRLIKENFIGIGSAQSLPQVEAGHKLSTEETKKAKEVAQKLCLRKSEFQKLQEQAKEQDFPNLTAINIDKMIVRLGRMAQELKKMTHVKEPQSKQALDHISMTIGALVREKLHILRDKNILKKKSTSHLVSSTKKVTPTENQRPLISKQPKAEEPSKSKTSLIAHPPKDEGPSKAQSHGTSTEEQVKGKLQDSLHKEDEIQRSMGNPPSIYRIQEALKIAHNAIALLKKLTEQQSNGHKDVLTKLRTNLQIATQLLDAHAKKLESAVELQKPFIHETKELETKSKAEQKEIEKEEVTLGKLETEKLENEHTKALKPPTSACEAIQAIGNISHVLKSLTLLNNNNKLVRQDLEKLASMIDGMVLMLEHCGKDKQQEVVEISKQVASLKEAYLRVAKQKHFPPEGVEIKVLEKQKEIVDEAENVKKRLEVARSEALARGEDVKSFDAPLAEMGKTLNTLKDLLVSPKATEDVKTPSSEPEIKKELHEKENKLLSYRIEDPTSPTAKEQLLKVITSLPKVASATEKIAMREPSKAVKQELQKIVNETGKVTKEAAKLTQSEVENHLQTKIELAPAVKLVVEKTEDELRKDLDEKQGKLKQLKQEYKTKKEEYCKHCSNATEKLCLAKSRGELARRVEKLIEELAFTMRGNHLQKSPEHLSEEKKLLEEIKHHLGDIKKIDPVHGVDQQVKTPQEKHHQIFVNLNSLKHDMRSLKHEIMEIEKKLGTTPKEHVALQKLHKTLVKLEDLNKGAKVLHPKIIALNETIKRLTTEMEAPRKVLPVIVEVAK